ncbi:hypothetical protein ACIQLK_09840 [Microbacterium sp. NPDC091382]|uniref:hypothetical protein n=1 Tax=Microbacterium sp. NPDC091382 TaxID=3364210 RepID=UPI0037F6536B
MNGTQPGLTVGAAKKIAQDVEDEIVSKLPAESIRAADQEATGVLMPCSAQGAYAWTGGTTIELSPSADPSKLISMVLDAYRDNSELKPKDITKNGRARAQLVGPYGSGYIIADYQNGHLEISSFSPCFVLPPDKAPEDEY